MNQRRIYFILGGSFLGLVWGLGFNMGRCSNHPVALPTPQATIQHELSALWPGAVKPVVVIEPHWYKPEVQHGHTVSVEVPAPSPGDTGYDSCAKKYGVPKCTPPTVKRITTNAFDIGVGSLFRDNQIFYQANAGYRPFQVNGTRWSAEPELRVEADATPAGRVSGAIMAQLKFQWEGK